MADLQFSIPDTQAFDRRVWETAFISGIEGIPWQCHHSLSADRFSIGRQIDESGKLNIVWPSAAYGNICLSTTSLRVGDHVYSLAVELARGTVHRLKTQAAEWQRVGLRQPDAYFALAETALNRLLSALTEQDELQRVVKAQMSIDAALDACQTMAEAFSEQALEARKNNEGRLGTLLGCQLSNADSIESAQGDWLAQAMNLVGISPDFGSIESTAGNKDYALFDAQVDWAADRDFKLSVGPLVDFRKNGIPDWMILLDQGYDSLLQSACQHVARTVERYRGKANIWNCATGLNVPSQFGWTDEEVLRMAVALIETVRRADDRTPVLLTIDQPWSEYLRTEDQGISPLHFADALIRADLGLSGLALDLRLDFWPGGSFPRDLIELNRLIDRWSMLGLPILIIISNPDGAGDGQSTERVGAWKTPHYGPASATRSSIENCGQIASESIIKLLASKPAVHAILWGNQYDQPGADHGLFTADRHPKPLLQRLSALRQACLQ